MENPPTHNDAILSAVLSIKETVESLSLASKSEDLALRDYALGLLAELGEARAELLEVTNSLEAERSEVKALMARLEKEMTRAFQAEKRLSRLPIVESQLSAVYASFTWKLGRFFMLPMRVLRRLQRR